MYHGLNAKGEKRMRKHFKKMLATAALAAGLSTLSASAEMIISFTKQAGTGTPSGTDPNGNEGFDVYRFYAKFDATSSSEATAGAKGLQSASVTLTTDAATGFRFRLIDADGNGIKNDVDNTGVQADKDLIKTTNDGRVGSMIRAFDFNNAEGDPRLSDDAAFNVTAFSPTGNRRNSSTVATPPANYVNRKSFRVEGALLNPATDPTDPPAATRTGTDINAKVLNAAGAGPGVGALFAIAVVPAGSFVSADYDLAADKGGHTIGSIATPEPTALGFIGLAGMGLLARRRRMA